MLELLTRGGLWVLFVLSKEYVKITINSSKVLHLLQVGKERGPAERLGQRKSRKSHAPHKTVEEQAAVGEGGSQSSVSHSGG